MGFSRQEYQSGLPCPPPGYLPNPETEPRSPALQVDSLPLSHREASYARVFEIKNKKSKRKQRLESEAGSSTFSLNLVLLPSLYGSWASPFFSLGLSLPIHKMGITKHSSGVRQATHIGSDCGVTLDLCIHVLRKRRCSRLMDGCKALCGLVWLECPCLLPPRSSRRPLCG